MANTGRTLATITVNPVTIITTTTIIMNIMISITTTRSQAVTNRTIQAAMNPADATSRASTMAAASLMFIMAN